jgi:hypothetical protein
MGWSKHAAPPIDAIVDDEEVVVAGKVVFVYAVQPAFLGCATEAVALCGETCILRTISGEFWGRAIDVPVSYSRAAQTSLRSRDDGCRK